MKHYVLGFAIDVDALTVLLIRKQRPGWQKGRLNGIGGHIEEGETPLVAMVREFKEETGIHTKEGQWKRFAIMTGPDWECECFKSFDVPICNAETQTDEVVEIHQIVDGLDQEEFVSNLLWLIHMAMDTNYASSDNTYFATIEYK